MLSSLMRRLNLKPVRSALRSLSSAAQTVEEHYARPLQWTHWLTALGTVTTICTVKAAQWTTGPTFLGTKGETKGKLMLWHKSAALLTSALFFPRVLLRAFTKVPKALEGHYIEKAAGNIGHLSLYLFMAFMPASGTPRIAMARSHPGLLA